MSAKPRAKKGRTPATPAPRVSILMGSASDAGVMEGTKDVLERLGIPHEVTVTSAHRSPDRTVRTIRAAVRKGVEVFVVGAGWAAHLAGVVAAHTTRPVIGVPVDSSPLNGMDSLLATVQMPSGIPVATVATGTQGARNAGYLAARILAVADPVVAEALEAEHKRLERSVVEGDRKVRSSWTKT